MVERVWQDVDKVNLFAWLDFCLQNDLNFEETISQHLTGSRKYQAGEAVTFTWKQVKQKLGDQARIYARRKGAKASSLQEILEVGSSAMIGMPQEFRQDIAKAVSRNAVLYAQSLSDNHLNGSTSKAHFSPPSKDKISDEATDNAENEFEHITAI